VGEGAALVQSVQHLFVVAGQLMDRLRAVTRAMFLLRSMCAPSLARLFGCRSSVLLVWEWEVVVCVDL
jgi:hypothetical protein